MGTNKKSPRARELLAQNVVRLRADRKITQERLGEMADLHPTYISAIENGRRNASLDSIERLAIALQIPIADLLSE